MGFKAKIGVCFPSARCFASFQIALLQVISHSKNRRYEARSKGVVLPQKYEEKEDGTCPVMARLTVGVSKAVFSAKMTVPADKWVTGRATGKSKTATEINRKLDELRASAISHWQELSVARENVTAEKVKNRILGMVF
jgi:hypothetical protein